MAIPLNTMIDRKQNVYETTCAAIKKAASLTRSVAYQHVMPDQDHDLDQEVEQREIEQEEPKEKVVSVSIALVLDDEVEYEIGSEE